MIDGTKDPSSVQSPRPPSQQPGKTNWAEIETWIFDLDNTIYPASCNLFGQIHERMAEYIMGLLSVDPDEAMALRGRYFREHGTTMRGLMVEHGIDPRGFLAHVHEIDLSPIPDDGALKTALEAL